MHELINGDHANTQQVIQRVGGCQGSSKDFSVSKCSLVGLYVWSRTTIQRLDSNLRDRPGCLRFDAIRALTLTVLLAALLQFGVGSTEVIEVPKPMVGRIIGKGGETIKDLQKRYNCSIQIDQGPTPCKVTITGPTHQIGTARRAIEDLIRSTQMPPHLGGEALTARVQGRTLSSAGRPLMCHSGPCERWL